MSVLALLQRHRSSAIYTQVCVRKCAYAYYVCESGCVERERERERERDVLVQLYQDVMDCNYSRSRVSSERNGQSVTRSINSTPPPHTHTHTTTNTKTNKKDMLQLEC